MIDRWAIVPESEAVAAAGQAAQAWSGDSVTYVLGPAATVVIIDAGDRPAGNGVQSFEDVMLRAPFPDTFAERLNADRRSARQILGFVRLRDGCLPLGRLQVSMSSSTACHLHLHERLPFDVLDRIRPTPPEALPDITWLDRLPEDPTGALREFVAGWYADVPAATAEPATSELALPEPLLEFYRVAAGRQEVLGRQNQIFPADAVRYEGTGGQVLFGTENQGCFLLLMDPTTPDPQVWYDGLADEPRAEREPLSRFLLQFTLCEAAFVGPYGGFAAIGSEQAQQLVALLRNVPLQPMRWPSDPTHYYVGQGVVAMVCDTGDDTFEVFLGSRHRSALRSLRDPGFTWQSFSG